jgi:hypothetical protein
MKDALKLWRNKMSSNLLFEIINERFKTSEEFRNLVLCDPYVYKLFHNYDLYNPNADDKKILDYLIDLIITVVKDRNEIQKELINKKVNIIELNRYQISKEFVNECIRSLPFREKIKMLFTTHN